MWPFYFLLPESPLCVYNHYIVHPLIPVFLQGIINVHVYFTITRGFYCLLVITLWARFGIMPVNMGKIGDDK